MRNKRWVSNKPKIYVILLNKKETESMITTAQFKSQIAKPFGVEMRKLGFKGNGFIYVKENEDFLFSVFISPGRWGGHCYTGLAIHPKCIKKVGKYKLDLKKLPIHLFEFPMSLTKKSPNRRWEYSDSEKENLQVMHKIVALIKSRAIPVIRLYSENPTILESFDVRELDDFHNNYTAKTHTSIATTDIRFAWALAIFFEKKNITKARLFAKYAILQLTDNDTFFGRKDFERILKG